MRFQWVRTPIKFDYMGLIKCPKGMEDEDGVF